MQPDLTSSGITQRQNAELVRLYREAAARLRGIVLTPPGRTASAQTWNQARASQQLAQIERLITDLKTASANWIGDKPIGRSPRDTSRGPVTQAVANGIAEANRQAVDAGVVHADGLTGTFNAVDHATAQTFAREIAIDLNGAADGMGQTAKKILRTTAQLKLPEADINRILAGGVISGRPTETIRQLREALRAVHGDTVTLPNGMHFEAGYYASLVARTQTRQATVHARHDRLQSLDLDLVSIIGRVSKNFCTAYLGQVFSLSGKSTKYPSIHSIQNSGPPFHPNCTKSTRVFIESLASDVQKDRADGLGDTPQLFHATPTEAQKRYQDLGLHAQVKADYGSKNIYGEQTGSAAGGTGAAKIPLDQYARESLKHLGLSANQAVSIAGSPKGATVEITQSGRQAVGIKWTSHEGKVEAIRSIGRYPNQPLKLSNSSFTIHEDLRGSGLGTEIFSNQVRAAVAAGVTSIDTYGARGSDYNGYYTWPRLGYDGDLQVSLSTLRAEHKMLGTTLPPLPPAHANDQMLSDLMSSQEGRDWWKANGRSVNLTFDLTEGSLLRRRLAEYQAERAAKKKGKSS